MLSDKYTILFLIISSIITIITNLYYPNNYTGTGNYFSDSPRSKSFKLRKK
jgi:hypothetical protein